ncbi:hypothetical protein D3C73_18700 [compost metagenome]
MPEVGTYILATVGFSKKEKPLLVLQRDGAFINVEPIGNILTLTFDTSQRHCIGWHDITNGESHVCPEANVIDAKYEQCPACQKRTGFNPAFYNTTVVSSQQEARNLEPHILYLAYFGGDVLKVGISHAARGNSRLLEQGARSALVLDTFPTAHIARQYESKIAALKGIAETVLIRKKIATLSASYTQAGAETKLFNALSIIESELKTNFSNTTLLHLDPYFFPSGTPALDNAYESTPHNLISGRASGMLGSLLFCEQQDTQLFLPLKKYTGYRVALSDEETAIDIPAQQISLF